MLFKRQIMITKKQVLFYVIGALSLGILTARLCLDNDISINNFYQKFDFLMHILLTIGIFMMAIGIKSSEK